MENEFKVTKEAILAAADKCSTAKDVLKVMFPEAFEEKDRNPMKYQEEPLPLSLNTLNKELFNETTIMQIAHGAITRELRKYMGRAFYISPGYEVTVLKGMEDSSIIVIEKRD